MNKIGVRSLTGILGCILALVLTMSLPAAEAGEVAAVNADEIKSIISENKGKVVVLNFWATWCPPCNVMKPTIEELEKELAGKAEFVAYDVDAQGEMAQKYGVMSIPTYVIEKDGKEVARTTGARPKEEFKRWVEEQL